MRILLALLFSPLMAGASIHHGDYLLTHTVGDINQMTVSSRYGTWRGYIGTAAPAVARHRLRMVFSTPDFFSDQNIGHIAIGLRATSRFVGGDLSTLELTGRGVVIGNVSQYHTTRAGCPGTTHRAAVAIETWWRDGAGQHNCVMGWTQSPPLAAHQLYRLTVEARDVAGVETIGYVLEQFTTAGWQTVADRLAWDHTPAAPSGGGLFLLEVFSTHSWNFYISDLEEESE